MQELVKKTLSRINAELELLDIKCHRYNKPIPSININANKFPPHLQKQIKEYYKSYKVKFSNLDTCDFRVY